MQPGTDKKYEPRLPSEDKKASCETHKVMELKNQKRFQSCLQSYSKNSSPLTINALEKHDLKHTSGPCQLRQFACGECHHSWWRIVLKSKPVSQCTRRRCGNKRYDALPREKEFGIGQFLCPNTECNHEFFGYCEAIDSLQCKKCWAFVKPYIHPKWKKKQKQYLEPQHKQYLGSQHQWFYQGRRKKPKPFNPSSVHVPTGGTVSTFLTQVDFEKEGIYVELDYDSEYEEVNDTA